MGWTATYFTTIIIEGNTPNTGIFFYSTLTLGGLIGSWAAAAGVDAYGNAYPAGINVTAGSLQGVTITNSSLMASTITSALMSASSISSSNFNGGAVNESVITFNSTGGGLWLYTTTTSTTTYSTPGLYNFPAPASTVGALNVQVWGGDAGGGGGSTSEGGEGGGGAEFAQEPAYSNYNPGGTYQVNVGNGGKGGTTSNRGTSGQQSSFDNGGVVAGGGVAGSNFTGGAGGNISTNTVHYKGGNGGSPSGFTASGGGGGRAGSTGAGGNGGNATSNTSPGFGGSAGSGTGGIVGSNGVQHGNNGNSGNAGGSGAGEAGSGTTYQNIYYDPTSTASYYGAGVGGGLRNTNGSLFQGCPDVPVTTFPGDQESFANYNYSKMRSDWSGWTIDQTTITINNQHSWYDNGCYCILGWAASPGNNNYNTNQFWCDQGETTGPLDISNYNGVIAAQFEAFIFGPSSSTSGGSEDLYNYGYFQGGAGQGGPRITINGHKGTGGIQTAGNGSNGAVIVSYQTSNALVGGASAITQTDAAGNALAVGWTGPVQAIQPSSNPAAVETWHTLTVPTTGTNCTAVSGTARYKLMAEHNAVWLDVQLALTSTGDFTIVMSTTLPATYRPTGIRRSPGATSGTITSENGSRLYVDTTGSVNAIGPNGGTSFGFSGMLPLD